MIGLAFALLIIAYAFQYTAVMNLMNGGNGPTLFESLGIKTTLQSPASNTASLTGPVPISPIGGNQVGQPPSTNVAPTQITNPIISV